MVADVYQQLQQMLRQNWFVEDVVDIDHTYSYHNQPYEKGRQGNVHNLDSPYQLVVGDNRLVL